MPDEQLVNRESRSLPVSPSWPIPVHRFFELFVVLIVLLLLSGCLGGSGEGGEGSNASVSPMTDANSSGPRLVEPVKLVEVNTTSRTGFALDVLCTFGGGPKLDRIEGNHVLPGTSEVTVEVRLSMTYTSTQVGYVLDSNGADHAPENNRSITWLPQVGPGEHRSFTVEVQADETEDTGEYRWAFYSRKQPPGVDDVCYTGGGSGPVKVDIHAVP